MNKHMASDFGYQSLPLWTLQSRISRILSIWLKSDLYFRYRIEDPIPSHSWWCSLLIILTNKWLKVFRKLRPFDLLIWEAYMPEVTRKRNNKTTYIIFKNPALRLIEFDWSKSWCKMQTTKFIQNWLEHDWTRTSFGKSFIHSLIVYLSLVYRK